MLHQILHLRRAPFPRNHRLSTRPRPPRSLRLLHLLLFHPAQQTQRQTLRLPRPSTATETHDRYHPLKDVLQCRLPPTRESGLVQRPDSADHRPIQERRARRRCDPGVADWCPERDAETQFPIGYQSYGNQPGRGVPHPKQLPRPSRRRRCRR